MGDASIPARLKVFISYSRRDEAFTDQLLTALEVAGFDAFLDQHDIVGGEAWETRLGRLIESADTMVFVISPESIAALRLGARARCRPAKADPANCLPTDRCHPRAS